jgi:hypothetical protein
MAEETEGPVASGGPIGSGENDHSAAAALVLTGASRAKADAYLDARIEASRLERENLIEQNAFELSHLRWRRFNDQMKGALQIMAVVLGLLVVIGVGAALWNASQADGLVIDSFTAPPGYAAHGLGGDVIATDLTNRLAQIRKIAIAHSISNTSSVSKDNESDVKVDIPETGISLGEAWRLLRNWLGNEQHVNGSLREAPDGTLVLSASFADGTAFTAKGPASDPGAVEQDLAEQVFAHFDPINMVLYLHGTDRAAEALKQAEKNARTATGRVAQSDAYSLWANETRSIAGDLPASLARIRISLALNPALQAALNEYAADEDDLGHAEMALSGKRAALQQVEAAQPKPLQGPGFRLIRRIAQTRIDELLGDFEAAEHDACGETCIPDNFDSAALYAAQRHDLGRTRLMLNLGTAAERMEPATVAMAHYYADLAGGNAAAAVQDVQTWLKAIEAETSAPLTAVLSRTKAAPLRAIALAHAGDSGAAEAALSTAPDDCYDCADAHGVVAAAAKQWQSANTWFARAVGEAPSLPFAYTDWGAMLLAKGDTAGAIAQFERAHANGPHFADPIEMWGEALMLRNRSDLGLAKFAQADRIAPNWGRLHLKWGEALWWAGRKDEARKQFSTARHLDLTPSETSELARMRALHG